MGRVVAVRENELRVPRDRMHGLEKFDGLSRYRNDVFTPGLHATRRNCLQRFIEVELGPLRLDGFIRATQRQPHQLKGLDRCQQRL